MCMCRRFDTPTVFTAKHKVGHAVAWAMQPPDLVQQTAQDPLVNTALADTLFAWTSQRLPLIVHAYSPL